MKKPCTKTIKTKLVANCERARLEITFWSENCKNKLQVKPEWATGPRTLLYHFRSGAALCDTGTLTSEKAWAWHTKFAKTRANGHPQGVQGTPKAGKVGKTCSIRNLHMSAFVEILYYVLFRRFRAHFKQIGGVCLSLKFDTLLASNANLPADVWQDSFLHVYVLVSFAVYLLVSQSQHTTRMWL